MKDILEEIIPKFYDGEIIGNIFWTNTLNGIIVFFLTAVLILPIAVSVKKYLPWVLGRKKVKEN